VLKFAANKQKRFKEAKYDERFNLLVLDNLSTPLNLPGYCVAVRQAFQPFNL